MAFLVNCALASEFQRFKNTQDAIEYFEDIKDEEELVFLDPNDPAYGIAQALVKKLSLAHGKINPFTNSLPIPVVVIVESPEDTAFAAGYNAKEDTFPLAVVISKDMLDNSEQIEGVMAHELAHLYLKHGKEDEMKDQKRWSIEVDNECNPVTDETFKDITTWINSFSSIGLTKEEAFEYLPTPRSIESAYSMIFGSLLSLADDKSCDELVKAKTEWFNKTEENLDSNILTYVFSDDAKKEVSNLSKKLIQEIKVCLKDEKPSTLLELLAKALKKTPAQMSPFFDDLSENELKDYEEESKAFNSAPSMIEGLQAAVKMNYDRMDAIEKTLDVKALRLFSVEDEADTLAVKALHAMNKSPQGLNDYLLKDNENSCDVDSQEAPEYGNLQDNHHSGCWRAWRNHKLYQTLGSKT